MIKYVVVCIAIYIFGILSGYMIRKRISSKRIADGVCFRTDDGEVYLKLSELAQNKLADPKTEALIIRVANVPTRNNQLL